jgi:hypothetical protein
MRKDFHLAGPAAAPGDRRAGDRAACQMLKAKRWAHLASRPGRGRCSGFGLARAKMRGSRLVLDLTGAAGARYATS